MWCMQNKPPLLKHQTQRSGRWLTAKNKHTGDTVRRRWGRAGGGRRQKDTNRNASNQPIQDRFYLCFPIFLIGWCQLLLPLQFDRIVCWLKAMRNENFIIFQNIQLWTHTTSITYAIDIDGYVTSFCFCRCPTFFISSSYHSCFNFVPRISIKLWIWMGAGKTGRSRHENQPTKNDNENKKYQ